jgi:hypothetical protein
MSENNIHFEEEEEVNSYAKLEGPNFKKFIHKLTIYLGRDPNTEIFENTDEQSIFIGDSQKISRRHAKLYWNYEKGQWEIQILSKNKAVINGQIIRNIDTPMAVPPCSAIKIDKYRFYFFPATSFSS